MNELHNRKCVPCKGDVPSLNKAEAQEFLEQTDGWKILQQVQNDKTKLAIQRKFTFKNFREVMAFLNRVAALAEAEGHHPDIEAHYREVTLSFMTHAINGLSENDFIMAAKVNQL